MKHRFTVARMENNTIMNSNTRIHAGFCGRQLDMVRARMMGQVQKVVRWKSPRCPVETSIRVIARAGGGRGRRGGAFNFPLTLRIKVRLLNQASLPGLISCLSVALSPWLSVLRNIGLSVPPKAPQAPPPPGFCPGCLLGVVFPLPSSLSFRLQLKWW